MNNAIKLMIEPREYQSKPKGEDGGKIKKSILHYPKTLSVEEIATELIKGKTMIGGYLDKNTPTDRKGASEDHWKSQQIIALDFDNEFETRDPFGKRIKVKNITRTLNDLLNDEFITNHAAFIYKTFSYKEDHPKFRVVFVFDKPFYQLDKCKSVIEHLLKAYPDADQHCSDGARLFYGTNSSGLQVINYSNRLPNEPTLWLGIKGYKYIYPTKGYNSQTLTDSNVIPINNKPITNNLNSNYNITTNKSTNNIELIRSRSIEELHNRISPESVTLHNNHQMRDYLKKQDLKLLLGVKSKSIYDIFGDEDNASGSIFQSNTGSSHWFYKCHSESRMFTGTVLEITQKLLNCSIVDVEDFLMEVYKIEIIETETQKKLKREIDSYKYILQSDDFSMLYPNTHTVFRRLHLIDNFYVLLDLVKENLTAECDDPRILFNHSLRKLAQNFNVSEASTGNRMNFYTFFELIYKLEDSEIPKGLLEMQRKRQKNKNYKYRNNTYEMKPYKVEFFEKLEFRCSEWLSKGLTTKTMTYEGILRNFGQEEAERVFPQDKGKQIPELHEDIVSYIETVTMNIISQKGWSTENEILENVKLYFKGQKRLKEDLMKRCIGEMLDKYNLERISCNKNVKKEMEITEAQLPLQSFPKIIRPKS